MNWFRGIESKRGVEKGWNFSQTYLDSYGYADKYRKIFSMLKSVKWVITVEEHFLNSGVGSMLSRAYVKTNPGWKLFTLGIPDEFIHAIKDLDGMREYFGISAPKIAEYIRKVNV